MLPTSVFQKGNLDKSGPLQDAGILDRMVSQRFSSLVLVCAGFFLLLAACFLSDQGRYMSEARPKTIILISVDTLNRNGLRIFNQEARPLPNLDRFGAESVAFTNAYTTASWTLPAHASLFTGLYPDRHGLVDRRTTLSQDFWTFTGALQSSGYRTLALTDEGYMHHQFGFAKGFDRYDAKIQSADGKSVVLPPRAPVGVDIFNRAIAYLESRASELKPTFLFLHTYSVHNYFTNNPWAIEFLGVEPERDGRYYMSCLVGLDPCTDADRKRLEELYVAELVHFDEEFGLLLEAIDRLAPSALVILVSDHGEGFEPARGRTHHGGRVDEDLIRIPFLVRAPGLKVGISGMPVSLVDVAPTMLELLGIDFPENLDGESFAESLYRDVSAPARTIYAFEYFHWWENGLRRDTSEVRVEPLFTAAIDGKKWYVRGFDGSEELYDMKSDPKQLINRFTPYRRKLDLRAAYVEGITTTRQSNDTQKPDENVMKQLESLGYIGTSAGQDSKQ